MSKKILFITSSPHEDGNTNIVTRWVSKGAIEAGATIEVIDAASIKYKTNGCIGCMRCQMSDKYKCVIDDDATPVIERIPQYDVLVFATPLYFFGPSAQLKLIIDRMFSLCKINQSTHEVKHNLKNMSFGLISTAGGKEFSILEQMIGTIAGFFGVKYKSFLVPFAGMTGEIKNNADVSAKAVDFGRQLCGI